VQYYTTPVQLCTGVVYRPGWSVGPSQGRLGRRRAAERCPLTTIVDHQRPAKPQPTAAWQTVTRSATDESACTPESVQGRHTPTRATVFAPLTR
jgi:hypothetical protein